MVYMLIINYRVGDIVDIKANGAVQKGSVNLYLLHGGSAVLDRNEYRNPRVRESDISQYAT